MRLGSIKGPIGKMEVLQQHFLFLWYRTGFKWVFECLYTAGCMEKKHPKTVEKKDVMSL